MLLHVLRHVDAQHGPFVVKEKFSQGPGELRLAHTCRSQKQERTDGALGIGETGAVSPSSIFETGIPVHFETTRATSSSSTSSFSMRPACCFFSSSALAAASCFSSVTSFP